MARAALLSRVLSRPRPAKRPAEASAEPRAGAGKASRLLPRRRPAKRPAQPPAEPRAGAGKAGRLLPGLARALATVCAFVVMVAFAVVLARLTLQPSPASEALTHSNLHPGSSIQAYLDQPQLRDAVKQIGGNLLLGVPFGVLVPMIAPRARGILRVLLLTATVMLMVELAQGAMVTGRAFDIDDVILNTTGALAGYLLLGRRLGRALHARR
ncbi:VanZ family protein [Streptomyces cadmiisoli]